MTRTMIIGHRVLNGLSRDRRLLALSVVAPLAIIYLLKMFFDTLPPTAPAARYAIPVAAFLVHFLAFLLCAIALTQERTAGTLERMSINGFRRAEIIGGVGAVWSDLAVLLGYSVALLLLASRTLRETE